jgi:hypothetical protein
VDISISKAFLATIILSKQSSGVLAIALDTAQEIAEHIDEVENSGGGESWRQFKVRPRGQYHVPEEDNKEEGATYSCLVYDLKKLRKQGDSWIIRVDPQLDAKVTHHAVAYTIPFGSTMNNPGEYLHGKRTGDVIENCFAPLDRQVPDFPGQLHSPSPGVPYAWPHGNPSLDLLDLFDSDMSTANGYSYGIPIGAQTNMEWLIIQAHFHNPEQLADLFVRPTFVFQTASERPTQNAGAMVGGVFPHALIQIQPTGPTGQFALQGMMQGTVGTGLGETTPEYQPCFDVPAGHFLADKRSGLFEQIKYVANSQTGGNDIKILVSGLHAHNAQTKLTSWKVDASGVSTMIDECIGCGAHHVDNFHVMDPPVSITGSDSFLVECKYTNPGTTPIVGGFATSDEMCRSWNLVAPVPDSGLTMSFVDPCNVCLGGPVGSAVCYNPLMQPGNVHPRCERNTCAAYPPAGP